MTRPHFLRKTTQPSPPGRRAAAAAVTAVMLLSHAVRARALIRRLRERRVTG
jgi:hypothetical protein